MQFGLANILFFAGMAVAFTFAVLVVGWLIRPRTPDARKDMAYECGEVPLEKAWFNFNPRFYIVALIFLIFDVEVAFTYPVAAVFKRYVASRQGAIAFVELLTFVLILVLGLAYVWRHGDLEWIRRGKPAGAGKAATAPAEGEGK